MTIYESEGAYYLVSRAQILDTSKEMAWAEKFVIENAAFKWILGRYAEADKANSNRQHFTLESLKFGQPTLKYSPMNINHSGFIVGSFIASEIVYPTAGNVDNLNPYLESLGNFWQHYHEEEYKMVERAHKEGQLFLSMESVPERIGCAGPEGCGEYADYEGRTHPSYCDHLNNPHSGVWRDLVNPHFTAGALILPPVRPGWNQADVTQISELVKENAGVAEDLYNQIQGESEHLGPKEWEQTMMTILQQAEISGELAKRKKKNKKKREKVY